MKKGTNIAVLASLLLCSTALGIHGEGAWAADTSTATTPGQVELLENDEATGPVDPTDPSKPGDKDKAPEDNGGELTGNKGPLSLDVAPAAFDFGQQKMYSTEHTYQAVNTDAKTADGTSIENQYLQVTDNRDADVFGWAVKVKQDAYLTDGAKVLTGTTINIPAGEARNSLNTPASEIDSKLKTHEAKIDLAEQTVFEVSSQDQAGKGTSTSMWKAADVGLTIPTGVAKAGNYTNTVTWTLTAEVTN